MLSTLFTLASLSAHAATLELRWTAPGAAEPALITFEDVKPGALPGFTTTGADGVEYSVKLTLNPIDEGQISLDVHIEQLDRGRRRIAAETLTKARVVTTPDTPATLKMGAHVPVEDGQTFRFTGLALEMVYTDSPA